MRRREERSSKVLPPRIYVDFHNADGQGRIRLNCVGTTEDLARHQIELRDGTTLTLYSDDLDEQGQLDELQVMGVVSFSPDENCWVAAIDWSAIRHVSEVGVSPTNGNLHQSKTDLSETGRAKSGRG